MSKLQERAFVVSACGLPSESASQLILYNIECFDLMYETSMINRCFYDLKVTSNFSCRIKVAKYKVAEKSVPQELLLCMHLLSGYLVEKMDCSVPFCSKR